MINLSKKRIALLWFFSILIMNIFIFLPLETKTTNSIEVSEEIGIGKVNNDAKIKSAVYHIPVDTIYIDDASTTNNWAWAEDQPWCTGSGTALDPYLLKNLAIDGGGSQSCIYIENSIKEVIIENCILYNGDLGIYLTLSSNVDIFNNEIKDMLGNGITLWQTTGFFDIEGNYIANCYNGISASSARIICSNNLIEYCTNDGIYAWTARWSEISNNIIRNNGDDGISILATYDATIIGNTVRDNNDIGIVIDDIVNSSTNNIIYGNFLKGNPQNGYDGGGMPTPGTKNYWDNGVDLGNYWDNFIDVDLVAPFGICDNDYDVPPISPTDVDHHPIYDVTAPTMTIIKPTLSQVFYSSGPGYSISASDTNLFHTWYTLDGGKTNYTDFSFTGSINQDAWNAVGNGQVTIRFYVDDKPGHTVFQDIIVYKEPLPPGLGDGVDDEEDKYFTLISPLGIMFLGGIAFPVCMILRHELKRTPKEKGRWITKDGRRIHIKGKKKKK